VSRGVRGNALVKASERHGKERLYPFGVNFAHTPECGEQQAWIDGDRLKNRLAHSGAILASAVGLPAGCGARRFARLVKNPVKILRRIPAKHSLELVLMYPRARAPQK
jgi:hypothetical protein